MGLNRIAVLAVVFYSCVLGGHAQSGVAELTQKYNAYQSSSPKLHLVFNQSKFSAGDTAWFKAYYLKENLTRVEGNYLVEVNLVNADGLVVNNLIFQVIDGLGYNQFAIPDSLTAGIYLVTAQSLMNHDDPDIIFKKEITIVSQHEIEKADAPVSKAVAEGGHLIRDVSNRVVIQTPHANSQVQIIDATGKEINRVTTDGHGTASFTFIPLRDMTYSLKVSGEIKEIPLPVPEDDGCAMILMSDPKKESSKILFASPRGSALRTEELIVLMTSRGKIFYTTTFSQGTNERVELRIPLHELPKGVAHISLLTKAGKVLGSRDFYNPGDDHIQANVHLSKDYFQTGEKVTCEVSITNNGNPVEGEFSVRVLNAGLFKARQQISIIDDLTFPSEIAEIFPINRSDSLTLNSLDNFLVMFSKDLPWPELLSNEKSVKQFQSVNTFEKRGVAYFTDTHLPVPDFTQILVYLQRSKVFRETFTQGNGKFWITLPPVIDQDEFFYLARVKGTSEIINVNVEWEDDSIKLPKAPNSRETENPDTYAAFATKKKLIDQSFGFEEPAANSTSVIRKDFESVIAAADITKNIQDYILFPTMEELLKEVIPSVFHRKTKTKNIVRVQLFPPMKATNDPIYIIDDIATKNTPFFLSLKPADILTMKIIRDPKKLYPLGLLGKNGIILVQTKKGDVRDQPEDPDKRFEGISRSVDFKTSQVTANEHPLRPDFRSTIYWNPSVKTDSNGKAFVEFICSGDVGKLLINLSGLTSTGEPFMKELEIEVGIAPEKN